MATQHQRARAIRSLLTFCFFITLVTSCISAYAACWDPRSVIATAKDPNNHTAIIAMHRGLWGGGNRLPENSMDAFIAADRKCIPAVETDVRLTSDNVPVLLHDQTVGRTTDIYKYTSNHPFDPETSEGDNPTIGSLSWNETNKLHLLIKPNRYGVVEPANETGFQVETVDSFYDNYLDSRMSVVVFLEIKDAAAVPIVLKKLYSDVRDYNHGLGTPLVATEFTVLKFNANIFPTPDLYWEALMNAKMAAGAPDNWPDPLGFPAYASNTLGQLVDKGYKDPYADSIEPWINRAETRIGVELNLKHEGGILQDYHDRAAKNGKASNGTFHALSDYMRVNPDANPGQELRNIDRQSALVLRAMDASYDGGKGECCYQLKDRLSTSWEGKKDYDDMRWSPEFVVGPDGRNPRFKIITTDDYPTIEYTVITNNGSTTNGFSRSPVARTYVFHQSLEGQKLMESILVGNHWYPDTEVPGASAAIERTPSVTSAHGGLHVFYKNNKPYTWMNTYTDLGWTSQHPLSFTSESGSSAVTYKGHMYIFGKTRNSELTYSVFDDEGNFDRPTTIPGIKTPSAPLPVVFNGYIYLFHSIDNGLQLYYNRFDGNSWSDLYKVEGSAWPYGGPAAIASNGKLFLFSPMHLDDGKITCRVFDGLTWSHDAEIGANTATGQSATILEGKVAVFYTERNGGKMGGALKYKYLEEGGCDGRWSAEKSVPNTWLYRSPAAY